MVKGLHSVCRALDIIPSTGRGKEKKKRIIRKAEAGRLQVLSQPELQ